MYNSQYYTCEQIDQRLLQGYLDDYNNQNNTNLTKAEFLTKLATIIGRNATIDNILVQIGYYVCGTAADTAAKTLAAANYELLLGGSLKVKFLYRNTADNATLKIGNADAKPLFYAGKRVGSNNSWEGGEVVEIFYDGTNYYANNVMGGSGFKRVLTSEENIDSLREEGNFILDSSVVQGHYPKNDMYQWCNLLQYGTGIFYVQIISERQGSRRMFYRTLTSSGFPQTWISITNEEVVAAINAEMQRAEAAFNKLILEDVTGSGDLATQIAIALNKNDGSEQDPDIRTLTNIILNQASEQKAGLLPAKNTWDSEPTENSKKLVSSGVIYKSVIYRGSLSAGNNDDINDTSLLAGIYYVGAGVTNMPNSSDNFIVNIKGLTTIRIIEATSLTDGKRFVKFKKSGSSAFSSWTPTSFDYIGSLTANDNIDSQNLKYGLYYVNPSIVQGTFPTGIGACLLRHENIGSNSEIRKQTLTEINTGYTFTRSKIGAWRRLDNQSLDDDVLENSNNAVKNSGVYKAAIYRGSISQEQDVYDTSLAQGIYYVSAGRTHMPNTTDTFILHIKGLNNIRILEAVSLENGKCFFNTKKSTNSGFYGWQPSSFNYCGSLTAEDDINSSSLIQGLYYGNSNTVQGTYPPNVSGAFLLTHENIGVGSNIWSQKYVDINTGNTYVRYRGKAWKKIDGFYVGVLTANDNIDTLKSEGSYIVPFSVIQGTLPSEISGQYGVLNITGGGNFIVQQLTSFVNNNSFKYYQRTVHVNGVSPWFDMMSGGGGGTTGIEDFLGLPKPNLLTLPVSDYTYEGITYSVNNDGSITINGTATNRNSYLDLSLILNRGAYTLWGMPDNGGRSTWHFLINPGGGWVPVAYLPNGYSFFVDNDNTQVNLWIRVMSGVTVENVTFYPVVSRQSWEVKDFVLPGNYDEVRPLYDYVDTTDYGWSGKKMLLTGDSITDGGEGEGFCSFGDIVTRMLNLKYCRNYGIGGSTIASRTDEQDELYTPLVQRWNDMEDNADIIYIHAGTNDWSSQVPLGNSDSQNPKEFNGALNIIMAGLKAKYPGKLIIFDTILNRIGYDSHDYGGVGTKPILTSQYSQCIIDKCKEYQLIYNDVYNNFGLDFKYDKEQNINAITNDGLHPNNNGIKVLGRKIAAFIQTK